MAAGGRGKRRRGGRGEAMDGGGVGGEGWGLKWKDVEAKSKLEAPTAALVTGQRRIRSYLNFREPREQKEIYI